MRVTFTTRKAGSAGSAEWDVADLEAAFALIAEMSSVYAEQVRLGDRSRDGGPRPDVPWDREPVLEHAWHIQVGEGVGMRSPFEAVAL